MSDNYITQLVKYCEKNHISSINYKTEAQFPLGYLTTITVCMGEGMATVEESDLGETEDISRSNAAKRLLNKIKDKSNEELIEKTQQLNITTNTTNYPKLIEIDSKVANISNSIGYLQEMFAKDMNSSIKYEAIKKSGEDHNPVFTIKCVLTYNNKEISGEGKARNKQDAKKLSALEVIKQLQSPNGSGKQSSVTNNNSENVLYNYFLNNFCNSRKLNQYIDETGIDYCQKLDKIALILGCRLDYVSSVSDGNQVVLKLIVEKIDYPLITTFGASNKGLDYCKQIAAKTAVLILKTLNTNEEK